MTGKRNPQRRGLRAYGLAMIAAVGLVLAGCAGGGGTTGPGEGAELGEGGELVVIMGPNARSFDPVKLATNSPGSEYSRMLAVYGNLLYRDSGGEVGYGFAESFTSSDGVTWELTIKPGITFTDGTPYDAEAVRVNWERMADPELGANTVSRLEGVTFEVTGELTLSVTLPSPDRQFDRFAASALQFIASPKALEAEGADYGKEPVGAGPFVLDEWVPGDHLTVVRNDEYYEDGYPLLDSIRFRPIADPVQKDETLLSGGGDITFTNNFEALDRVKGEMHTDSMSAGGGIVYYFNTEREPFNDPRARKAVMTALDGKTFASMVDAGEDTPQPRSLFAEDSPFYDESLLFPKQDVKEAQRLANELADEGTPLEFTYTVVSNPASMRATQYMQAQLNELDNVNMKIEPIDVNTAFQKIYVDREFDITNRPGTALITGPAPTLFDFFETGGRSNLSGEATPEMEAALEAARAAESDAELKDAVTRIQEEYLAAPPMWIVAGNFVGVSYDASRIGGITQIEEGGVLWERVGFYE